MKKRKHTLRVKLSEEQENRIAEKASTMAVEKLYATVGKAALRRTLLIVGLGVSALVSAVIAKIFS